MKEQTQNTPLSFNTYMPGIAQDDADKLAAITTFISEQPVGYTHLAADIMLRALDKAVTEPTSYGV